MRKVGVLGRCDHSEKSETLLLVELLGLRLGHSTLQGKPDKLIQTYYLHTCIHICIHTLYMYTHTYMYICTCTCIYIGTLIHTYTMYIHMYTCIHTNIQIHACMHAYIHVHTYIVS